jgi:hypothetical protein
MKIGRKSNGQKSNDGGTMNNVVDAPVVAQRMTLRTPQHCKTPVISITMVNVMQQPWRCEACVRSARMARDNMMNATP